MKMGWILTGGGFPAKWRKAWEHAIESVMHRIGGDLDTDVSALSENASLDLIRHVVQLASEDVDERTLDKVKDLGLAECFEPPVLGFEQLATYIGTGKCQ